MAALVTAENKKKISANRKAIFELEGSINYNKARAYLVRSLIQENAAMIAKNQSSAFMGNRQLANENTEALFRNRITLFQCLPSNNDVEVNFREAKINQAKLQYLEHRSRLNGKILSISKDLAGLNAQAIEVNRKIMEANEEIRQFNSAMIDENSTLITATHHPTPESNAVLIEGNATKVRELNAWVGRNGGTIDELLTTTEHNRESIAANAAAIAERRQQIMKNHDAIAANRARIAEMVGNIR